MSTAKTLAQILALTQAVMPKARGLVEGYVSYFKNNQGDFKGEKKTYQEADGYDPDPSKVIDKNVVTTVDKKLEYFIKKISPDWKVQLDVESTNASGPSAELIIGDESFGEVTTLELMRLKSLFGDPKLEAMIKGIPTRKTSWNWHHQGQGVFTTDPIEYMERTTHKVEEVLPDPNVTLAIQNGQKINYSPQTTIKTIMDVVGKGTHHYISSEWSYEQKAAALDMLTEIQLAITDALERANRAEVQESSVDIESMLTMLFTQ
jgi:hypothetical protein